MLFNEGLENINDLLLLASGKACGGFKKLAHFTGGAGASNGFLFNAQKMFDGNFEHLGQLDQLLGTERDGMTFPIRVGGLGDVELFGDLGL